MQASANSQPSALQRLFLLPVHAYRRLISPLIAPRCRYYPSCSSYAVEAIQTYGILRGTALAAWRLLRCNPLSDGGFDYVQDQKLFKHDCAKDHKHGEHSHGASV